MNDGESRRETCLQSSFAEEIKEGKSSSSREESTSLFYSSFLFGSSSS